MTNCPICSATLNYFNKNKHCPILGRFLNHLEASCINPSVNDPLHYYNCIMGDDIEFPVLLAEEFTVNLGDRYVMMINNYETDKTFIKTSRITSALELNFLIQPDFPKLISTKKKISLSLVFS